MSVENIKEVVKERYGQAALRVIKGGSTCCGAAPAVEGCPDPITFKPLRRQPNQPDPGSGVNGLSGLRQSHGSGRTETR